MARCPAKISAVAPTGWAVEKSEKYWEEAREVVKEIEATNAGQTALQNSSLSLTGHRDEDPSGGQTGDKEGAKGGT